MAMKYGKYLLEKQLAVGGMAEVFLANQTGPAGFRKTLCIKRILPNFVNDASFIEMFLDEARTAAQLSHPNIVQIYELGETEGSYYIAMEYIRGPSVSKVIRRLKQNELSIPLHYAAKIIANVCAGLEFAHTFADADGQPLHLVHRDISPDNILVSFTGAVKMIDFGIAKAKTNQSKTQAGAVKGKFSYMSPEQIMGANLDGRSDLFSLGIVLYELTTLQKPFGEDADLMTVSAIVNDPPPLPSEFLDGYPAVLQDVIVHALAKDRRERYASAQDMQHELERFIHEQGEFLSERDIGNYMTRLFSDSPDDIETLRQLGSGVRMRLTGVPVVRPKVGVESEDETVVGRPANAVTPAKTDIKPAPVSEPAPVEDPDATKLMTQAAEEPEPTSPRERPPKQQAPRTPPKPTRPDGPKALSEVEPPVETQGGGGRKLLWAALVVLLVGGGATATWYFLRGNSNASPTEQKTTEAPLVAVAERSDAGAPDPVDAGSGVAAPSDAGSSAAVLDTGSAKASVDVAVPPKSEDAGTSATAPQDAGHSAVGPTDAGAAPPPDTGAGAAPHEVDAGSGPEATDSGPAVQDAGKQASAPDTGAGLATRDDAGGSSAKLATQDAGATTTAADVRVADTAAPEVAASAPGTVRVTSEPVTDVYVDDKHRGRTPMNLELRPGQYSIRLKGKGGLHRTVTVQVLPGDRIPVNVHFDKGIIAFDVERGVTVFLDGVPLGQAPVTQRGVWEGKHKVSFKHRDGRTVTKTVKISKSVPKVLVSHRF